MTLSCFVPHWYPHKTVCWRKSCREAVEDAIRSTYQTSDWDELVKAISHRHREKNQVQRVGVKQESFADIMLDGWDE